MHRRTVKKDALFPKISLLFAFLLCNLCTNPVTAKKHYIKKLITSASVYAQLSFLASDTLEGRRAGSNGGKAAGEYIMQCFRDCGVKPYFSHDNYCQYFEGGGKRNGQPSWGLERPDPVTLNMRNIVGMVEGKIRDEYIIVGAHYDHLGVGIPVDGDSIYNGADDNASGIVAVLQLAKAFAAQKKQPKRTILFALWDGEEQKMSGSMHFVKNFADSSNIKAYINFDMIGRDTHEEQPNSFYFYYADAYPVFAQWGREAIKKYKLDLSPSFNKLKFNYVYIRMLSDYLSFSLCQRPFIHYNTGIHEDLHKPSDETDKINIDKATAIIQSAYYVINQLSERTDYLSEPM